MYNIYKILTALCICLIASSCYKNEIKVYSGPSQVHFVNSYDNVIIVEDRMIVPIEVGITKTVDYDQTFKVVIDTENSTAIEGVHFELASTEVVVSGGSAIAEIELIALNENAVEEGATLRLTLDAENKENVAIFDDKFEINLFKFCEFDRKAFVGRFNVTEKAKDGTFVYEINIKEGSSTYAVVAEGLWDVTESQVEIMFDRKSLDCNIPDQSFFDDPDNGYDNVWIKSLDPGMYNSCLGTVFELEYFVYPKEDPLNGFDRGTFTLEKIAN